MKAGGTAGPVLLLAWLATSLLVRVAADDWKTGRASFYGTDGWSIHRGNCGFGYQWPDIGTGWDVAAIADAAPEFSGSCGQCYEVKCEHMTIIDGYNKTIDRTRGICYDSSKTVVVRTVDACPCEYPANRYSNRRWCCNDNSQTYSAHFDISIWAFEKLANTKFGVMGIKYRRVPCSYQPQSPAPELKNPTPGEAPPPGARPPNEYVYVKRTGGIGGTQGGVKQKTGQQSDTIPYESLFVGGGAFSINNNTDNDYSLYKVLGTTAVQAFAGPDSGSRPPSAPPAPPADDGSDSSAPPQSYKQAPIPEDASQPATPQSPAPSPLTEQRSPAALPPSKEASTLQYSSSPAAAPAMEPSGSFTPPPFVRTPSAPAPTTESAPRTFVRTPSSPAPSPEAAPARFARTAPWPPPEAALPPPPPPFTRFTPGPVPAAESGQRAPIASYPPPAPAPTREQTPLTPAPQRQQAPPSREPAVMVPPITPAEVLGVAGPPAAAGGGAGSPIADCMDVLPPGKATCKEHKDLGNCGKEQLKGYCLATCGACAPSSTKSAAADVSTIGQSGPSPPSPSPSPTQGTKTAPSPSPRSPKPTDVGMLVVAFNQTGGNPNTCIDVVAPGDMSCVQHKDAGNCDKEILTKDNYCAGTCQRCK